MPRATCERCQRPEKYCYCNNLPETTASIDLVVLQHPSESKHALNTARIAALGISNCDIFVGEDFTHHPLLQERLTSQSCCLLFPTEQATSVTTLLSSQASAAPPQCCIVIDGTWRKARKIFYCNPFLHTLPAITLEPAQQSEYRIRKAPSRHSLSTVEAIVSLLRQAENNDSGYQPLLDAFTRLIDSQINAMGIERYNQNYQNHLK